VNDDSKRKCWAGLAERDTDVWRQFIGEQIPRIYGLVMRLWPNPSLAEELVQKTVFDAVRGFASFDPSKGNVENWILGIAQNNIRLELRRRAGRPSVDGDLSSYLETIDREPLPDEIIERRETAVLVRAAMRKLESREQAVLKAKYLENLSAQQIAQQIGVTEKAVHSLLYRARNSLRAELKRLTKQNGLEQKS
jgi:RNA polymerase sigma factor (sigma-70 family)